MTVGYQIRDGIKDILAWDNSLQKLYKSSGVLGLAIVEVYSVYKTKISLN